MKCGSSKEPCNQDKSAPNSHCGFEDLDHSVLQQPLNLGVTNVKQILKCIQSGSREIKDIILNECNIIYECKVCLGLFRSLANFLYHKRCYCKKHLCEDMVLFENFEEAETIVVKPEAPKEKTYKETKSLEKTEDMSKISDCTVDLVQADIPQEMDVDASKETKSKTETSDNTKKPDNKKETARMKDSQGDVIEIADNAKDKPSVPTNSKSKVKLSSEPQKTESPMISRRTRDKNAHNPVCSTKVAVKAVAPEEPPLKCAKIITAKLIRKESNEKSPDSKKDNRVDLTNKEVKTKKIEFSKLSGALDKRIPPFPKIIFKTIDSTPNAVYQSNDKKKLETFGVSTKYETSTVQTKVDNDKLIIVLKKDTKSDNSSDSKTSELKKQTEAEKVSDFHLTRRKRLMARNDCNVHELKCLTCKTQFMSLKTLYFHMLSLHSKKRLYYPCPFCKTLFVQMYGVTRHLISIHNKSKDQINKLREVIKKKSVWKRIDDVNPSFDTNVSPINYQIKTDPPPPPPEKKIETPEVVQSDNAETESLKTVIKVGKNVTLHQCAKCNRVFGRKSSQVSHQKFCIMNAVKTEPSDSSPTVHQNPPVVSFLSLSPTKSVSPPKPSSVLSISKSEYNTQKAPQMDRQNSGDVKVSIRPKRGAEKQMHKDFVNSQTLKWRSANRIDTNANAKTPPLKKANGKNLEKKVLSIMNPENLTCLKCDKKFSSYSNLRRHVAIHVGWTRFKCKYCEYQAYNKSQCWAHVQKAHSVDGTDIEKSIVNLLNSAQSASKKMVIESADPVSNPKRASDTPVKTLTIKTNSIPKVKISKKKNVVLAKTVNPEKKQLQIQKKEVQEVKKDVDKEPVRETTDSKKEKSQMVIPPQKFLKKDVLDVKKEKILPTISFQKFQKKEIIENKKDKPQHIIPIQKLTIPDYKRETNYKSVTTSNPTTIILSKKIPSSTVQSIMTISPESMSSTSKMSPIRTSPRKNEIKGPGERLITTLVTRSSAYSKNSPIQIKLPPRSNSVEEISKDSVDKNCSKKERLISEWFPKRDVSSANVRRESAPLIIGLVPAVNAGLNSKAKSPSAAGEKSDS